MSLNYQGDHYEHDGFSEKEIFDWFEKGNMGNSLKKWDLKTLEITKVPFIKPVDPARSDLIPKRIDETYTMLMITCCTKS